MNERKQRVEAIFLAAIELGALEEREAFVSQECAGDPELRREVEELLQAAAGAEDAFQTRAREPGIEQTGARIGRYHLLQKIGEGGCGVVYMAEQETPVRRRVALKIVKLGMDTRKVVARFEAERQALALMDHPNIAKVLDAGATETGRPYFVMELVRGIQITEYCDEKELTAQARLELFIQVCQAVQHAHQKGIIHRDLKPSNILVTLNDGVPVPKVIDFGIAKATEGRLTDKTLFTAFEQFIGTPAYMSPEQAVVTSLDVDTRSDIYSLGVLLYELLTGKTPFDTASLLASGLDAMRRTICETEPVRPSTRLRAMPIEELTTTAKRRRSDSPRLVHLLSGDLDWIVMKCLEKDRTRRYATANGLAADIQRHLNQEPVVARPPSTAYRLERFVRRNQRMVVAGVALAVILVAGSLTSSWQALRARRAEREQSKLRGDAKDEAARAEQEKSLAERSAYAARMLLAQTDWDNNNIAHLRQILQETCDYPDRGFEWYYWQRQCHSEVRTLYGHLGPVRGLAISPDGERILTGSEDGTAKVWEVASGRELFSLIGPGPVFGVAWSPDGKLIVTAGGSGTAKVWDAWTGRELLQLSGHTGAILCVAFSPNGNQILTGGVDKDPRLWDAHTGKPLLSMPGNTALINAVAFAPNGQRLVIGNDDDSVVLRDVKTGIVLRRFNGHLGGICAVAVSPDGSRILGGSGDNTIQMWEADTGAELLKMAVPSKGALPLHTFLGGICGVAFSADGKSFLAGSYNTTAGEWDATSGRQRGSEKGHTGTVYSVAYSPDGKWLATGSGDGTAKIWPNEPDGGLVILDPGLQLIAAAAISRNGSKIAVGRTNATLKICDPVSGRALLEMTNHTGSIRTLAFSPDGRRIVAAGHDNIPVLWDESTGQPLRQLVGHKGWVRSAVFSPDGRQIATASNDESAKVWDVSTGDEVATFLGHTGIVLCVTFSADGRRLLTGSVDRTARVWEIGTRHEICALEDPTDAITAVAFSADGRRVVTGCQNGTARVWNVSDARAPHVVAILEANTDSVGSLVFSADGQRVLSGSADGIRVWDATSGYEVLTTSILKPAGAWSGAPLVTGFFADGTQIVCVACNNTVQTLVGASEGDLASWRADERLGQQRLAALRKAQEQEHLSRSRDHGAIRDWLMLAPIPLAEGETGAHGLERKLIPREMVLRPRPGDRALIEGQEFFWQEVHLGDYAIDFNRIFAEYLENSAAYAVCYLIAERDQKDLRMKIGSDDESKVYLNGRQVYEHPEPRSFVVDDDESSGISLNRGTNVLVFKVVNEAQDWQGSVRLTDKDGNPVKGISVTLSP